MRLISARIKRDGFSLGCAPPFDLRRAALAFAEVQEFITSLNETGFSVWE